MQFWPSVDTKMFSQLASNEDDFENGTISLLIEREANYSFVSLSIRNDIVPFSSVNNEMFHAVFKSCRFKIVFI